MPMSESLIAELDDAIKSGSKDKRVDTLRRITDLFVAGADRFNDHQIEVFDSVLGRLIERIEARALVELSQRLAPVGNAPLEVVRRLAGDDDIAVAEPVLSQSTRLSDADLIDIANTKTQAHLLAISLARALPHRSRMFCCGAVTIACFTSLRRTRTPGFPMMALPRL